VEALHHKDNRTIGWVVQPASESGIDPAISFGSFGFAENLIGTDWIIQDRSVTATPHSCRAHAGRYHPSKFVVRKIGKLITISGQLKSMRE
jgi:hypothetical protein